MARKRSNSSKEPNSDDDFVSTEIHERVVN